MSRFVTIASLSSSQHAKVDQKTLISESLELITKMAKGGVDIIAFPEIWCQLPLLHRGVSYKDMAEEIPGPLSKLIAATCSAHEIAAVWPMLERRGDKVFNTAVFIGEDGKILGRRDKAYLIDKELDNGVSPGCIFDTIVFPWGKAASAICFDANFGDVWERLSQDHADIIFFPSMFQAPRHLAFWALEYGYYIVSALTKDCTGMLFGQCGEILVQANENNVLVSKINLNRRVIHMDNNLELLSGIKAKYGDVVQIQEYEEESRLAISVETNDLDVEAVLDEFQIERLNDYISRMRKISRKI